MIASECGQCEVVKLLLDRGAEVGLRDCNSALVIASECGQCEVVKLLLDRGAEVGLRDCWNGKSALMIASKCGQCEVVKLLLDAGAQVDMQDKLGRTAMTLAINYGHWEVGILLLERGAQLDSTTLPAIMSAVIHKCRDLLKCLSSVLVLDYDIKYLEYLGENSAQVKDEVFCRLVLCLACGNADLKVAQEILARCPWVGMSRLWGVALFVTCAQDHSEILEHLLEKGFPQDLVHYGEYSAMSIYVACAKGHCEVVELLLKRGALVNAVVGGNRCGLMAACEGGHCDVVSLLLEHPCRARIHANDTRCTTGLSAEQCVPLSP